MDSGLYTNRVGRSDFIEDAIIREANRVNNIYIASVFFTNSELLNKITKSGCRIKLIVRLGYPTSPKALIKSLENDSIDIRYYTGHSFHPKLYIFGNNCALLGSANLTRSGIMTNTEIMLKVGSDNINFEELAYLFSEYWENAHVLTFKQINDYHPIYTQCDNIDSDLQNNENKIINRLGKVEFQNIKRGQKKRKKEEIFIDDYNKTYQECVSAFRDLEKIYLKFGKRKFTDEKIPLRLEIDSFISYTRAKHAVGDIWENTAETITNREHHISEYLTYWHDDIYAYFEDKIVKDNYPLIKSIFNSIDTIHSATDEQIFNALNVIHSFHDRLRFYKGGLSTLKSEFFKQNNENKIRNSLSYLLYGKDLIVKRMYNMIYNPEYKLNEFGTANVQELIGWINRENLPVINGRTTKILKFFGYEVKQL